jgi:hypothetical protein
VFHGSVAAGEASVAAESREVAPDDEVVDISDLIYKSGIMLAELADLEVCPAVDNYREAVGVDPSEFGAVTPSVASFFFRDLHIACMHQQKGRLSTLETAEQSPSSSSAAPYIGADDCDEYDEDMNYLQEDDVFTEKHDSGGRRRLSMCAAETLADTGPHNGESNGAHPHLVSDDENDVGGMGGPGFIEEEVPVDIDGNQYIGKIHWDSVFESKTGPYSADEVAHASSGRQQVSLWQQATVMNTAPVDSLNEYSFFNFDLMNKQNGNDWAGSRHWKVASRSRNIKKDASEIKDVDKKLLKSKKGAKPTKSSLDFADDAPSEDLFISGDSNAGKKNSKRTKADPTVFSVPVLARQQALADDEGYLLPDDAHVEVLDLCRLMLVPNIIYPNPISAAQIRSQLMKKMTVDTIRTSSGTVTECVKRFNINSLQDKVWGEIVDFSSLNFSSRRHFKATNVSKQQINVVEDDADDYQGDYGFGFGADEEENAPEGSASVDAENLAIDADTLLKASRVVEKVVVG